MVGVLDGRREIFAELQRLFADTALAPYRARFLAGNASRFLRLRAYAESSALKAPQRDGLRALLARIEAAEAAAPQ